MKQSAADKPVHSYQRKAAIVARGIADYAIKVHVKPIENFDLNRTIFNTLEGNLPRKVIQTRIAKDVTWQDDAARALDGEHEKKSAQKNAADRPQTHRVYERRV